MTRYATAHAAFEIESAPSQPQVAWCHGFFVMPAARGKGHAHQAKRYQEETLRGLAYDYALCTVMENNDAQKRVLEKAGWKYLDDFPSSRQDTRIELWGHPISHGGNTK